MPNKKQQPGRSNFLASLIANYINAEGELQNFTHVDGISNEIRASAGY
jgi:hypothetical protein